MDPTTIGALGGAVLGLLNTSQQQKEANRQRQYQAMVARFSPWTHMQAQTVSNPNPLAGVMQGGLTGMAVGQGLSKLGPSAAPATPSELNPEESTGTGDSTAANFRGPSNAASAETLTDQSYPPVFDSRTGGYVPMSVWTKMPSSKG